MEYPELVAEVLRLDKRIREEQEVLRAMLT
jgi:hypothetical protein